MPPGPGPSAALHAVEGAPQGTGRGSPSPSPASPPPPRFARGKGGAQAPFAGSATHAQRAFDGCDGALPRHEGVCLGPWHAPRGREANQRRQRHTIRYRGLVPTPPPSALHSPRPPPAAFKGGGGACQCYARRVRGGARPWAGVPPPPAPTHPHVPPAPLHKRRRGGWATDHRPRGRRGRRRGTVRGMRHQRTAPYRGARGAARHRGVAFCTPVCSGALVPDRTLSAAGLGRSGPLLFVCQLVLFSCGRRRCTSARLRRMQRPSQAPEPPGHVLRLPSPRRPPRCVCVSHGAHRPRGPRPSTRTSRRVHSCACPAPPLPESLLDTDPQPTGEWRP